MQQHSLVSHDGLQIATYHWLNTVSDKHIFVAHGLGEHAQRYQHLAEFWRAEGYNVHALDHRGHGRSAGERGHVSQWKNFAHDLQQLISQYQGRRFLVAHSMGGAVAILYQLLYPGTVQCLALSGPATDVSLPMPAWKVISAATLSKIWPTLVLANEIDPTLVCADPAVVRDYQEDPLVHNKVSARFFSDYLRTIEYIKKQVHKIKTPVAIWHGAEDKIVEPWISADLYARLRCPAKQREVLDGVYHEILFEKNGLQVAAAMLNWFEQTERKCA
ncbi:MAG: lysophospholipase [Pseudomonadales bacterium]